MNNDLAQTISKWMKSLGIPVSKTLLRQRLERHPDYPSALSITDTLEDLDIENMALQVEKENLPQVPLPFLAYLNSDGGNFRLIADRLIVENPSSDFYTDWNGVVIVAEKPEAFSNPQNIQAIARERKQQYLWASLLLALILISLISAIQTFSLSYGMLLLTSLVGIAVSSLIVMQELGVSNEFTETLCSAGKNKDCSAVIQSQGNKLLKWLSWSDIGIVFFISQWLILLSSALNNSILSTLILMKWIAAFSFPFMCFSVYYQWKIAKKWCTLCLTVVGLLVIQALILLQPQNGYGQFISWSSFALLLIIFSIITTTWLLLKPLLKQSMEMPQELSALARFKSNPDIVLSLLQQQRKVDITPFTNELEIASSGAPVQILVACNPYCAPCAKAHIVLHEMTEKFGNQISIIIRFAINAADKEDKKTKAAGYLLQAAVNKPGDYLYDRKFLHDWFDEMDFEKFRKQYPLNNSINTDKQLQQHDEWAEKAIIEYTPTVFINGFEMPKQYTIGDLPILIRGILNKGEITITNKISLLEAV